MIRQTTAAILVTVALSTVALSTAAQPDPVLDSMQAELKRSLTLSLGELDKPYFISYEVDDQHIWSAGAMLGGLVSSNTNSFRSPRVRIRVGDYKFDNTNWTGANAAGPRYELRIPLEDDNPLVMRQFLWLATDSSFKGALQSIARKRAALRNLTITDQLADFTPPQPFVALHDYTPARFDDKTWTERVRNVSKAFSAYPALRNSSVDYTAIDSLHRLVTSEGTLLREPDTVGMVEIRASTQAADGMILRDAAEFYTRDIKKMFSEDELTKAANQIGSQLAKLAVAPMGEDYAGPVLFEGMASPQLLADLLGRNVHISRKALSGAGGSTQAKSTDLEGRRGVRIMPEFFDVVDDPTLPLFGQEEADEEGVQDKPVTLVEKGVLKDFLRSRQPVRGYNDSNGRGRLAANYGAEEPVPTNLIVKARETSTIAELRQKLLDLVQQRGLPYAIIVRKLDFPSSATLDEARKVIAAAGTGHPVSAPVYLYRLYPDGHEELVRGQRFRSMSARSLKDILAAGDDSVTFNYLDNGAPFALLGYGNGAAEVTVVAPSLLIDDLEMTRVDDEQPKLPLVPSPFLQVQTAASR